MNGYSVPTVKFKCCNTTVEFHSPRMFQHCDCGKCAYDSGDGRTARYLGDFDNIEVIGYNIKKDADYCKQHSLTNTGNKITSPDWESYWVNKMGRSTYVVFKGETSLGVVYSSLRDARKGVLKVIRGKK